MQKIKKLIKKVFRTIGNLFMGDLENKLISIDNGITSVKNILIDSFIKHNLFENPKYSDHKRLNKYEYQVYSQSGEDGIIQEIFGRIGTANKFFVEFGVEGGLECNSLLLLLQGWTGCWIDGSENHVAEIKHKFAPLINDKKLMVKQAHITAENIEGLLESMPVPHEFDLLSIDIDRNDYWVWKAIAGFSPRVVIIEYNAIFKPPVEFIVKYEAAKTWGGTSHFGASLKSLEILGSEKGYKLVGCNFLGANAFFIRQDLVKDKFFEPFTAENHYEPPRYYAQTKIGHERDFGAFEKNR